MTSKKLKIAANSEDELVEIKFISGLRDLEAKLRLLDGFKAKPTMSTTEMTDSLQFRSHAKIFASSLSGKKPFIVNEEISFNFKKHFESQKTNLRLIKAAICALGVEVSHILVDLVKL